MFDYNKIENMCVLDDLKYQIEVFDNFNKIIRKYKKKDK